MVDITIVFMGIIMVYKPTYNWGAPSCGETIGLKVPKFKKSPLCFGWIFHGLEWLRCAPEGFEWCWFLICALRTVWVVLTRFQGDGIPPISLARARSTTRWRSRRSSTASWEIWNIARSGKGSCHQPHQGFKIERPEIIASEDKNPRISHISSYVHMILYSNLLISSCCLSFGPSYLMSS